MSKMSKTNKVVVLAVVFAISAAAYYGWQKKSESSPNGAGAGAAPSNRPVSVLTVIASKQDYPLKLKANGVVTAINTVDIRPQINSVIAKVHIKEGQFVRAGELLFTLDSRNEEVNLVKAQAQLDKDLAALAESERQFQRNQELFNKKFVAASVVETSQSALQAQQALIASDKAAIVAAKVALGYSKIVAPSAGRTGVISVYPGSLVQANASGPALVSITQMDPIAIAFPLPQRDLSDAVESIGLSDSYVMAGIPEGKQQFKGKLKFVDNLVDASSGTIKLKAEFDNKAMKLWPGAYATVEMTVKTLKDAIVVPQSAVIFGAKGKSVYIVDADGKAALKPIELVYSFGTDAVIKGIEDGSQVVLDGKENLKPGNMLKIRNNGSEANDKLRQRERKRVR